MKKILLYGIEDNNKLSEIKEKASHFGANTVVVGNKHLDEQVSDLIKLDQSELIDEERIIDTEYMLLIGFDEDLESFIDDLRKENLNISLMSMLTETSKEWTLDYLMKHILEERQMVTAFNASKKLIAYAKTITTNNPDPEIDGLIGQIEILLGKPQLDLKALKEAYEQLYSKLNK